MVPLPCTLAFVGYQIPLLHRNVFTENLINWIHILNKNEATLNMVPNNADLIVWVVVGKKGDVNTIHCDPEGAIWYEISFFESDAIYAASWYVL